MSLFDAERLTHEAQNASTGEPQCKCLERDLTGWGGWPANYHEAQFAKIGTLAEQSKEEATLDEYHPANTSYWSIDAPIAPRYYPYNQCAVWRCITCGRLYLRYNDDGAYHSEQRIRRVSPERIVDAPFAAPENV